MKSAAKTQYSRKPVAGKGELARAESAVMPVLGQRVQMWEDNDTQDRPATVDQLRLGCSATWWRRSSCAGRPVISPAGRRSRRLKAARWVPASPLRQLIQDLAQGIGRDLPARAW